MPASFASQPSRAEVSAVIYPPCLCGAPFGQHQPPGPFTCSGYMPSTPPRALGTIAYRHPSFLCRTLWRGERLLVAMRTYVESLSSPRGA